MMQKGKEEPSSETCLSACANCATLNIQLQVCSRCKSVRYCSNVCQAAHWKKGGHKKICNAFLAPLKVASNHDDCAICLDALSMFPISELSCGHCFHIKCIKRILKLDESLQVCPLCRAVIVDLKNDTEKDLNMFSR